MKAAVIAILATSAAVIVACGDSSSNDSPDSNVQSDAGTAPENPDADASDPTADTIVRVHYPLSSGHAITLRGQSPPLAQDHGMALAPVDVDGSVTDVIEAHCQVPASVPVMTFTPMYDDTTPARGGAFKVARGSTVDIYPHFFSKTGSYSQIFPAFHSTSLNDTRIVWAYVPPSYGENTLERYPVLYMHDGQNDFDPAATGGGVTEMVPQAIDQGTDDGTIAEVIVVAIQSVNRNSEFAPVVDPTYVAFAPARGPQYVEFLAKELKPAVDASLRTKPERENTGTMGSSLGGLITAFAGVAEPEVFGVLGEMSASAFWGGDYVVNAIQNAPALSSETAQFDAGPFPIPLSDGGVSDAGPIDVAYLAPVRVYVDQGSTEALDDDLLAQAYRSRGLVDGVSLKYFSEVGGAHDVESWGRRFPGAAAFMFPGSLDGH